MPRAKEHTVSLTISDRRELKKIVSSGIHPARMIMRARILLELDETDPPVEDRHVIARRLGTSVGTVFLVAKQFTLCGGRVEEVIVRKKRVTPPTQPKVTGEVQARIIALSRMEPPVGFERWSLRLLEKHVMLVEGIPPMDHATIGRALKRGLSNPI